MLKGSKFVLKAAKPLKRQLEEFLYHEGEESAGGSWRASIGFSSQALLTFGVG